MTVISFFVFFYIVGFSGWLSITTAVLCLVNAVELVAGSYLPGNLERYSVALAHGLYTFEVYTRVIEFHVYGTCSGTCDEYLVTGLYLACLNVEFTHTKVREVFDSLTYVNLAFRSL